MTQQIITPPITDFEVQLTGEISSLKKLAMKFTTDSHDINDLVQDTLIKAMRFCHQFRKGSSLKAWLFVIMRNTYINNYRKTAMRRTSLTSIESVCISSFSQRTLRNTGENRFVHKDIEHALMKLPKELKLPFKMFVDGFKYQEIAEEIGIPIGTVKTRIHVGRLRLKKILKEYSLCNLD